MELKVGPYDKVSVPLTSGHKDMTVVIKRGKAKNQTLTVTLAKPVKQVPDASMTQGTTRVRQGRAGRHRTGSSHPRLRRRQDRPREGAQPQGDGQAGDRGRGRRHQGGTRAGTRQPAAPQRLPGRSATAVPGTMSAAWAKVGYCETGSNPSIVAGQFYGMYMMTLDAWHVAGGTGLPNQPSAAEQTMRAQILYNQLGSGPWPVCGKYLP